MLSVMVLVFLGVFAVTALLLAAAGTGASKDVKRALARLESTLAVKAEEPDELVEIRKQDLFRAVPFVNRWLMRLEVVPKLQRALYQANLKWSPAGLFMMCGLCWAIPAYLTYLRTGIPVIGFLVGLLTGALPLAYVSYKRGRRLEQFEEGLPAALGLMVSSLRGGQSLVASLALVGREAPEPIGREFRVCFDEQNYGLDLRTALENLATRVPLEDVRIIMTAILIHRDTGGNLAELLDKCAQVIRERFRLKREIRVRTAQGRLTGLILSFLPLVLGTLLFLVNPENMSMLWRRPEGQKMLYAAVCMTVIGGLLIRRIVRIRV
ncbi:MAG TPA: type II secretion system F family protein [Bryobacteraceae bacterium]|jgi:tight adherence protein B|nr:type II secretion system F family protein [Bryobacteraceae bacterium]